MGDDVTLKQKKKNISMLTQIATCGSVCNLPIRVSGPDFAPDPSHELAAKIIVYVPVGNDSGDCSFMLRAG